MRIKQSFRRLEIDLLLIFPPPSSYHLSKQRLLERLWRRLRMDVTRRYDRVVQIRPCTTGETKCVQASGPQVRQATRLIAANYRGYRGSSSPLCASTTAFLVSFASPLARILLPHSLPIPFPRITPIYCSVYLPFRLSFHLSSVSDERIRIFGTILRGKFFFTLILNWLDKFGLSLSW